MEAKGEWFRVGVIVVLLLFVLRFLNWVWFKPKKIEKFLRKQGLKGNRYKLLYGDSKEMTKMLMEAQSKPISISDDIVPRVLPFQHKLVTNYGKTFFTWLGPRPIVHIIEPTLVKEVLANNYVYQKSKINPFIKLITTGLVGTDGDKWAKHRKIINPAFRLEKLKNMGTAFHSCCEEMVGEWEEILGKKSSCEVDVWPYMQAFSADVISRTAFGSNYEEGKRIFELQRELASSATNLQQSLYIPGSRFLPTKSNKRMKEIDRELNNLIKSIVNKRITAIEAGESSKNDLLGILLDSNYNEIKENGNSKFGLSINEVIEECKVFYFAGQETTGNLLVWTMIMLAQHTDWQERAREEVSQFFGGEKPYMSDLNHLKIVSMIFNEVLRLYSPVPVLRRMVHHETKLGDLTIPAGSFIELDTMFLHHDRNLWGDDVMNFNPERFSEGVLKATKGQTSYVPFSGGPRICIGQNFALMEAKFALATILQHFSFNLSPSYSHAPRSVLTLQPQFGAPLILHKL